MSIATAAVAVDSTVKAGYRDLLAALKATGLLAGGTRSMLPHVELAASDGTLTVTAADADAAVTVSLPATVTGTGRVMVPWNELSKILPAAVKGTSKRQLDQLRVDIDITGDTLTLGVGGYSLPITVAPDATLPTIPQATPGTHVTDRDQFAAMFTRVVAAAGTDQLLPIFTHVHTVLADTSITMLATDRYRLSRGTIDAHGTSTQTILLPGPLLAKLLPFCDGTQIILGTDGHDTNQWITLTSGTLTVRILHPHGDYPRVAHLFNLTQASTATLDRTAFRDAADRAQALTAVLAERNTPARLLIDTNQVTVAPGARERTADAPTITADTQLIAPFTGGINPAYLVDGINHTHGDTITIEFNIPGKPIKLTGADTFEHVIMLMRLPN